MACVRAFGARARRGEDDLVMKYFVAIRQVRALYPLPGCLPVCYSVCLSSGSRIRYFV